MRAPRLAVLLVLCVAVTTAMAGMNAYPLTRGDLSSHATYSWGEGGPAVEPEVQRWIVEATNRELQNKGYRLLETGQADLLLEMFAGGMLDTAIWSNYIGSSFGYGGWMSVQNRPMGEGGLYFQLKVSGTGKNLWSTVLTASETDKVPQKKVNRAVRMLFLDLPAR